MRSYDYQGAYEGRRELCLTEAINAYDKTHNFENVYPGYNSFSYIPLATKDNYPCHNYKGRGANLDCDIDDLECINDFNNYATMVI